MKWLLVLALVGGCADDGGPRLTKRVPDALGRGGVVEIDGTRLCGKSDDCAHVSATVQLGTSSPFVDAVVMTWTPTVGTATIPATAPAGNTSLVVTVDGLASNELSLDILLGAR